MSFLNELLSKDIQALSEENYNFLKEHLESIVYLRSSDAIACSYFYGLWWKYSYVEGKPSKDMIFESLRGIKRFTAEEFYKKAKEGGGKLGLKWYQNGYTFYFRTLLLQSGIPLKNLKKYGTYYRTFLIKVIEFKPEDSNAISNNFDLIKYLPLSTRNEVIYEAALKISKAIWEDTEDGKRYLEILEQNNQRDLVVALKSHRKALEKLKTAPVQIKAYWELTINKTAEIILKSDLPDKITREALSELIRINDEDLVSTYNFFCEEKLLSTYRKNIKGDFVKYTTSSSIVNWNPGSDQLPNFYFSDNSGRKFPVLGLIKANPTPDTPSCWIQLEENRWIMLQKSNHNGESAFVLSGDIKHFNNSGYQISISGYNFYFFEITESTVFKINDEESINFYLKAISSFDWYINSRPTWIESSNKLVVTGLPRIRFYSENGLLIPDNQITKKWRSKGSIAWKEFQESNIPPGIIEFKFTYQDITEYETVFNIGSADLKIKGDTINQTLTWENSLLNFSLKESPFYTSQKNNNIISLKYLKADRAPKFLECIIHNHIGRLRVNVVPFFNQFDIIDNEGKIVANKSVFLLNDLYGYRLICSENQSIKFYNKNFRNLIISRKLNSRVISLINFNKEIQSLFLLDDVMASDNTVVLEIPGKTFYFKSHNCKLKLNKLDSDSNNSNKQSLVLSAKLESDYQTDIFIGNEEFKLFAIPLNCEIDKIVSYELEKKEEGFVFPEDTEIEEFIVFNQKEAKYKILPTYIRNQESFSSIRLDSNTLFLRKSERIESFSGKLSGEEATGEEWSKLNKYIRICIQENLPFSAFDIIRAACSSSELTAKLFLYLACNCTSNEDFFRTGIKFEEELGFKFHWCAYNSFNQAFDWIGISYKSNLPVGALLERASLLVKPKYLANSIDVKNNTNIHLTSIINEMRSRLGETVIKELPTRWPWLREDRKHIIPAGSYPENLKILIRCPIAIALSKADIYTTDLPKDGNVLDLWHFNNSEVRRNIIYCENKDEKWYDTAIDYTLQHLHN